MQAILEGHDYVNEVQTITQLFFPNESFCKVTRPAKEGLTAVSILKDGFCRAVIYDKGIKALEHVLPQRKEVSIKNLIKLTLFYALSQFTGTCPPWGILTGIRPSKIVWELWRQGYDDRQVARHMEGLLVSPDKIKLCLAVAHREKNIIDCGNGRKISLYAGIPFCPTRCLYCSFTSYPLQKYSEMVEDYLAALIKELKVLGDFAASYELETIYIGGGTPTSLNEEQLFNLLDKVREFFSFSNLKEFTIEAGRPDTISQEKLTVMKEAGVSRISINTQTLREGTLELIGRKHTAKDFLQAFFLAREKGFNNINADIILGLPNEGVQDVKYTLDGIIPLKPEGITAHVLAVKRASRLKEELMEGERSLTKAGIMEEMLAYAKDAMENAGLSPYYMYRQKNTPGNFENVGYCRPGYEGMYNIQIMEERQTILGAGAGAVTKIVEPRTNRISRIFNVKNPEEYIGRIDEMLLRKEVLNDISNP